jgi:hypothetical protein
MGVNLQSNKECEAFVRVKPYFLNVDLEIWSASKPSWIAEAMGKRVTVLYSGPFGARRYFLALETSHSHKSADATIHDLCAIVESLPSTARRLWNTSRRQFDVGYELRVRERFSQFSLRPNTLERISKLGATLTVTYYRGETNAQESSFENHACVAFSTSSAVYADFRFGSTSVV